MYNQRTLFILARRERARIKKILEWMGHRRDELPVGSLKRNGKYYYRVFYEDGQKNHVMIPEGYRGKWALIDELRERRYISAAMPVLENNLRCIERFQKGFRVYDPQEISARLPQAYEGYDLRRICLPGDVDVYKRQLCSWSRLLSDQGRNRRSFPMRSRYSLRYSGMPR